MKPGRPRWAYHLTTAGSVLLLTALVMLLAALVATLAGDAFTAGVEPGRGVTTIPVPTWTAPGR